MKFEEVLPAFKGGKKIKRKTAGGLTWCLLDCRPVRKDEVTFYEDKEDEDS